MLKYRCDCEGANLNWQVTFYKRYKIITVSLEKIEEETIHKHI